MYIEKMIDYLSFNCKNIPDWLRIDSDKKSFMSNYDRMYECECGSTIHYGNRVTDKFKIIMAGVQCREWQLEFGTNGFAQVVSNSDPDVTRIDLAITQFIDQDGLMTVDDIQAFYVAGMIDSKHVKNGSTMLDSDKLKGDDKIENAGRTFYIGDWQKRAEKGIFRAYDKGLEMDLGEYLITRLEVEEKRKSAQVSFQRLADGNSISQVFQSRFNISDDYYQEMLDCEPIELYRGKQKNNVAQQSYEDESFKKWGWFMGTVAPTLGKLIASDHARGVDNTDRQEEFWEIVRRAYDQNI